jgi:hypothetical protein
MTTKDDDDGHITLEIRCTHLRMRTSWHMTIGIASLTLTLWAFMGYYNNRERQWAMMTMSRQ